jgi:hypothetical protein
MVATIGDYVVIGKVKVKTERDKATFKYLKSSTQAIAACLAVHSRVAKSERERGRKGTYQRENKRTVQ